MATTRLSAFVLLCGSLFPTGAFAASQKAAGRLLSIPAVTPLASLPSLPISAAPASVPAAPAAASAFEGTSEILAQLAPENAGRLSGERAKELSGRLIDPAERPREGGPAPVLAAGLRGGSGAGLHPSGGGPGGKPPRLPRPARTKESLSLSDRWHYSRLWVDNMWFYVVTNIVSKWGSYQGDWLRLRDSGQTPAVSRPRSFFAHMRVMGETGEFYIRGFVAREDAAVMIEARRSFERYFDAPAIGKRERAAFERFLERAAGYNAGKRGAENLRKIIRDAMLKASTTPVDKIADYFDGVYVQGAAIEAAEFQGAAAEGVLKRFREIVLDEMRAEPLGVKGRVLGVILIGSFATGAATPHSDFDGEIVTEKGSAARLKAFVDRVIARWEAEGRQKINPVTFHLYPFTRSRALVRRVHDTPYLTLSPDESVVSDLAMRPGEAPAFAPGRTLTRKGAFLRRLQYATVYFTSLLTRPK